MSLRLDDAAVALFQFSQDPRPTGPQLAQVIQRLVNAFQPSILALCQQHNITLNRDQLSLVTLLAHFASGGTAPAQAQNALSLYVHVTSTVGRLRTLTPPTDLVAAEVAFAAPDIRPGRATTAAARALLADVARPARRPSRGESAARPRKRSTRARRERKPA